MHMFRSTICNVTSLARIKTNSIKANLVMPCDLEELQPNVCSGALQHNVGSDEDVRNLIKGDCDTSNYINLIE